MAGWTTVLGPLAAVGALALVMWLRAPRRRRLRWRRMDETTARQFETRSAQQRERAAVIEAARREWS